MWIQSIIGANLFITETVRESKNDEATSPISDMTTKLEGNPYLSPENLITLGIGRK